MLLFKKNFKQKLRPNYPLASMELRKVVVKIAFFTIDDKSININYQRENFTITLMGVCDDVRTQTELQVRALPRF